MRARRSISVLVPRLQETQGAMEVMQGILFALLPSVACPVGTTQPLRRRPGVLEGRRDEIRSAALPRLGIDMESPPPPPVRDGETEGRRKGPGIGTRYPTTRQYGGPHHAPPVLGLFRFETATVLRPWIGALWE